MGNTNNSASLCFLNVCNNRLDAQSAETLFNLTGYDFRNVANPEKLIPRIKELRHITFGLCEVLKATEEALLKTFPTARSSQYHAQGSDDGAHRFVVIPAEGVTITRAELLPLVDPSKIPGFSPKSRTIIEQLVEARTFLQTLTTDQLKVITDEFAYKSVFLAWLDNGQIIGVTHTGLRASKTDQWRVIARLMREESIDMIGGDFNSFDPSTQEPRLHEAFRAIFADDIHHTVPLRTPTFKPLPWDIFNYPVEMQTRYKAAVDRDGKVVPGKEDEASKVCKEMLAHRASAPPSTFPLDNIIVRTGSTLKVQVVPYNDGDHFALVA